MRGGVEAWGRREVLVSKGLKHVWVQSDGHGGVVTGSSSKINGDQAF